MVGTYSGTQYIDMNHYKLQPNFGQEVIGSNEIMMGGIRKLCTINNAPVI